MMCFFFHRRLTTCVRVVTHEDFHTRSRLSSKRRASHNSFARKSLTHRSWPSVWCTFCGRVHLFFVSFAFLVELFSWSKVIFSLDGCVFRITASLSCLIFFPFFSFLSVGFAVLRFGRSLRTRSLFSYANWSLLLSWTTRCMRRGYRDFRPVPTRTHKKHIRHRSTARKDVCVCGVCN
jgi:hypothetical protein